MKKTRRLISTVAALAVVVGGFGAYRFLAKEDVASIIHLDINPSIEIQVDDDAEVIRAIPLNDDAKVVLGEMHLEDTNVTTAVNAVIGALLKHGYIDELANSILVSIEDGDSVRGAKLKEDLMKEINAILGATKINASILVQTIKNADAGELAEELGISKGKASLIQNIVDVNNVYEVQELAKLSVNELNLVLSNPKNDAVDVDTTGAANENAYIGEEKAKEIAFGDANVKAKDVREVKVEFDYDFGKLVYEVDFASDEYEYDYSVDAENGTIVHSHREVDDDYVKPVSEEKKEDVQEQPKEEKAPSDEKKEEVKKEETKQETTDIGKEKAKKIALDHAGVSESKTSRLTVEKETDDGRVEYHVEFRVGNKEYDYEISANTGKILDYDVDVDDDDDRKTASNDVSNEKKEEVKKEETKQETTDIGKEKAKKIALDHAGVAEAKVSRLTVEKETDDGRVEYHVEFRVGNKEYDYEISADTGKILDYDVDVDDDDDRKTASNDVSNEKKEETKQETTDIGKEKAKKIALDHAGVAESKTSRLTVEKETDDGRVEYHVEFRVGNKEYDYEISASSGKILDCSVDVDDDDEKKEEVKKEETKKEEAKQEITDIGKEKAKKIALEHAGLSESKVTRLQVEKDVDDGKVKYEVEFKSGNKEYSYEINGSNGKILDSEVEVDD